MDNWVISDGSTSQTIADGNTLTITSGEGIDAAVSATDTLTIAGEDASTSNKGVASFSSDNFAVSSGAVTIKDNGVAVAELADIARGSIVYGNASAATAELTKGGANTVLTSDGTDISWAAAGGGKILQVVQQNVTTNFSQAQTSGAGNWTTLNNFSQAISPTASNSTILVMVNLSCVSGSNNGIAFKSVRGGSTDIQDPADSSNRKGANARTMKNSDNNHNFATVNWSVLDSPATTSSTTYTIQFLCETNGTVYINRTAALEDTAEAYGAITNSTMWLLEIGA